MDYPSAYVTLIDKKTEKEIDSYLVSALYELYGPEVAPPQRLKVDGKKYELALRFERHYKPYSIHLDDVRKDDYVGTDLPKNFSSDVRLVDEEAGVDRKVKIWMNNPHRYGGDTFYQTSYHRDGKGEITTLSVVSNTGWMIPYVACMIVVVGLAAQFVLTLGRFIQRRSQIPLATVVVEPRVKGKKQAAALSASSSEWWLARFFPLLVVLAFGGWALSKARTPSAGEGEMDFYAAGKLPVMYQGRVKPLDTLARQTLCMMSNRQTSRVLVPEEDVTVLMKVFGDGATKPVRAIEFLFDAIAKPEVAQQHRVVRIENIDVLNTLGLERRKGLRYSIDEIQENLDAFMVEAKKANSVAEDERSTYEKKLLEVDSRIRYYTLLHETFPSLPIPQLPTEEEFNADRDKAMATLADLRQIRVALPDFEKRILDMQPPLAVPDPTAKHGWALFRRHRRMTFSTSWRRITSRMRPWHIGMRSSPPTSRAMRPSSTAPSTATRRISIITDRNR